VTGNVVANCSITAVGRHRYAPWWRTRTNANSTGTVTIRVYQGLGSNIGQHRPTTPPPRLPDAGAPRAMRLAATAIPRLRHPTAGTTTSWTTANPYIPSAPSSKAARTFNMDTVVFGGQDVTVGTIPTPSPRR